MNPTTTPKAGAVADVAAIARNLRGLLAKSTKGPWKAQKHGVVDRLVGMWFLRRSPDITLGTGNDGDAALIAATINALPMLLDEVEARASLDVEDLIDRVANAIEIEMLSIESDVLVGDLTDEELRGIASAAVRGLAVRQHLEQGATAGVPELNEHMFGQGSNQ